MSMRSKSDLRLLCFAVLRNKAGINKPNINNYINDPLDISLNTT